jgi:hypothetical protein
LRRNVEVEIQGFGIQRCGDTVVAKGDSQIHEGDRGGTFRGFPFEAMEVAQASLEGVPFVQVIAGRFCWDPNSNDVINVATEKQNIRTKFGKESLFKDGIEKGCVRWGRRGAHRRALELKPMSVTELDDIIFHDQGEGGEEGRDRDVGAEGWVAAEVASNLPQRRISMNVSIHTYGIRGEEAGIGREVHGHEFFFEIVRALEVRLLLAGNFLEFIVNPYAEAVEEAAGAGDDGASLERTLVHFHREIKIREGVETIAFKSGQELAFGRGEDRTELFKPSVEKRIEAVFRSSNGSWVEVPVRGCVREVVTEGEANVFLALDDGRAQVLVTLNNEEIVLVAQGFEGKALVTQKVLADRSWSAKVRGDGVFELVKTGRQGARDEIERGLPYGWNVHPRIVVRGAFVRIKWGRIDKETSKVDASVEPRVGAFVSMELGE